jgi:phenylalanyl-tRNA synthetase beta subunit
MEYSLNDLNQSSDLNNINLKELVEDLNLIGFEVDNVFEDTFKVNSFYKNFRLLLKIPANREDLLTEHLLTKELSDLFNFKKKELWKTLQPNYSNLLKFQYSSSLISEKYPILSQVKNIILYNIELENFEQFSSPLWLQEKLKNFGKIVQGDIRDLTELINLEWGNSYLYYLNKYSSSVLIYIHFNIYILLDIIY